MNHSYTLKLGICPQPNNTGIADVKCDNCGDHQVLTFMRYKGWPLDALQASLKQRLHNLNQRKCNQVERLVEDGS